MDNVGQHKACRLRPLGLIPLIVLGLLSTLATTAGSPDLDFSGPPSLDIPIPPLLLNPMVDAGSDQLVLENSVVTLSGQVINDAEGLTFVLWTQTGGPTVTLATPRARTTTFTAPSVDVRTELTFVFSAGASVLSPQADSDAVIITVDPHPTTRLSELSISAGAFDQIFQPSLNDYTATVRFLIASTSVTATTEDPGSTVTVNGASVASGEASEAVSLAQGINTINVVATAEDGVTTATYTVDVTRQTVEQFAQQAYVKASDTTPGGPLGNCEFFPGPQTQEGAEACAQPVDGFGRAIALDDDSLAVVARGAGRVALDGDALAVGSVRGAPKVYMFTRDFAGVWAQQAILEPIQPPDTTPDEVVYIFSRDEADVWTQTSYVEASNVEADDNFGWSIALEGDTLVVGAFSEDSNATGVNGDQTDNSAPGSGAAYVFMRDAGDVWIQQAYLKASEVDSFSSFGASLALDGDTLAVGAPGSDVGGKAYVFVRDGSGQWGWQADFQGSDGDLHEVSDFGLAVSLDGDTLAVGAPFEFDWGGSVYVFTRDGRGLWTEQAFIRASNPSGGYGICFGEDDYGDAFGTSLVLSRDRLVIGAPGETSGATGINGSQGDDGEFGAGAVYLFIRDGSGLWSQQAYVKASNTDGGPLGEDENYDPCPPGDGFGAPVVLDGTTLVVGASGEDSAAMGIDGDQSDNSTHNAGAVYVFQ